MKFRNDTKKLAKSLNRTEIYYWLVENGYFPESYVLPPCFRVTKRPLGVKCFARVTKKGFTPPLVARECCTVHFPKTDLADRHFGIMHPEIHNDIAFHLARNWKQVVDCLIPDDSVVTCYSFPIPMDSRRPGRVGSLRSGRMIYQFLWMTEDDLVAEAYQYSHVVRADIKNFYPSIYTHSIAWAIHGKQFIRKGGNRSDFRLLGNRLDRLFQYANDQKTNGVPIGPAVSDIVAEIVAAAVDRELTKTLKAESLPCEVTRFKDDYRILVRSEWEGRRVIKMLQGALQMYNLELSEDKTSIHELPEGLFRPWVSLYHAVHPRKRARFKWKEFQELYLAVLRIDQQCPGTGVIDRFLADIVSRKGRLKVGVSKHNLQKALSMLLMLGRRRVKAFPKILALIELILRSPFGAKHVKEIVDYLGLHLQSLSTDEERNTYLITWIAYFFVSNNLKHYLPFKPTYKDPITRSVMSNRGLLFTGTTAFKLFEGCRASAKRVSMLEHLDVFNPPSPT